MKQIFILQFWQTSRLQSLLICIALAITSIYTQFEVNYYKDIRAMFHAFFHFLISCINLSKWRFRDRIFRSANNSLMVVIWGNSPLARCQTWKRAPNFGRFFGCHSEWEADFLLQLISNCFKMKTSLRTTQLNVRYLHWITNNQQYDNCRSADLLTSELRL